MSAYEFQTVDVFTETRFGGNPLAVFPDAAGLSEAQMLALAREFNLSETTCVFPPADPAHRAHVRIFTPGGEIPFAGHPNVGTAYVLAHRDPAPAATLVFEEKAGLVAIELQRDTNGTVTGAKITAPQPLSLGETIPVELVAASLGLAAADVRQTTHRPIFAGVGMGFVVAELASVEALGRAAPNLAAFREAAARYPKIGWRYQTHLYVRDAADPSRLRTRMFAPLNGIPEDAATGSANATLAALLVHQTAQPGTGLAFDIQQGIEMRRPSRLLATAHKFADGSVRATVAGSCVPVMHGHAEP